MAEFGTDRTTDNITFVKLKSCQYLHHCIKEAFRMVSIVPIMERVGSKDVTLPKGGGACGTKLIYAPRVSVSSSAPPDRWEGRKTSWEFFTFGVGPRSSF